MKKILIIIVLTATGLSFKAMQQIGQQVQAKIPQLQTLISQSLIKNVVQGTVTPEERSKILQTLDIISSYPIETLSEATKKSLQNLNFIASFIQNKPKLQIDALVGIIQQFPDNSIRIDNYLGIGDTLFLSGDLGQYIQVNSQGNIVVNSSDKRYVKSTPAGQYSPPVDYYTFAQGIESQHYPYKIISTDEDQEEGPFLKIRYPQDFEVEFRAGTDTIRATSYILSPASFNIATETTGKVASHNIHLLLSLHKAITNLDGNAIKRNAYLSERKKLIDYILITDNALHRAIKKALTATGQQLEDAKAIIQMLLDKGANLEQKNSEGKTALQLAASNPDLMATIQQAYARRILLDAINSANKNQVSQVITVIGKQGYTIPQFLNTSYGADTPLVHALKLALEATNKPEFDRYIAIAQLLLSNGATFNNPSGDLFLKVHGRDYVEKIAPVIK